MTYTSFLTLATACWKNVRAIETCCLDAMRRLVHPKQLAHRGNTTRHFQGNPKELTKRTTWTPISKFVEVRASSNFKLLYSPFI